SGWKLSFLVTSRCALLQWKVMVAGAASVSLELAAALVPGPLSAAMLVETWYKPAFASDSSCRSDSSIENGQPNSSAALGLTKSSGWGGFWSSKYFFSVQVRTTPPRLESSM